MSEEEKGYYIWRTRKDDKVRSEHAAREGYVFSWDNPPEDGHPGEAFGCRCWAVPLPTKPGIPHKKPNCDAERVLVLKLEKNLEELKDVKDKFLEDLKKLYDLHIQVSEKIKMSFGSIVLAELVGKWIKSTKRAMQILLEYFKYDIGNVLENNTESLMDELTRLHKKIDYKAGQLKITEAKITTLNKKIAHAYDSLKECEKRNEKFEN